MNELGHHRRFATRAQAVAEITEWIEAFYNRQRRHSAIGNLPPAIVARQSSPQPRPAHSLRLATVDRTPQCASERLKAPASSDVRSC